MAFDLDAIGGSDMGAGSWRSIVSAWVAVGLIALLFIGVYGLAENQLPSPGAAALSGVMIPGHATGCVEPPASLGLAPNICDAGPEPGTEINRGAAGEPDM